MKRTFQYKACINKTTARNAEQWLCLCRILYNVCLEHRRMSYKDGQPAGYYDQAMQFPDMKKECPEFKQVGSQVLQDVVNRVDLGV